MQKDCGLTFNLPTSKQKLKSTRQQPTMVVERITFHPSALPSTMAASFHLFDGVLVGGRELKTRTGDLITYGRLRSPTTRQTHHGYRVSCCSTNSLSLEAAVSRNEVFDVARAVKLKVPARLETLSDMTNTLLLADLDPATAKLAMSILGPFFSAFAFLFILRIVMSWYPKLPVGKFPYVLAYAPTEPLLIPTRKLIPPLAGVDVTPVVWFGIVSFLNEILVGPQGLLVLVSQQVS